VLTLPGVVKYFGNVGFSQHPEDFQSYRLNDPATVTLRIQDSIKEREIIAFQCALEDADYNVKPTITWQRCNSDGTFTDITNPAPTFSGPDERAPLPMYLFLQSGLTGYYQILDGENPTHANTMYRCKAASSIPGDTAAPVFSNCATVVWHDASISVPPEIPVFGTIPLEDVPLLENEVGYMACSLQSNPNNQKLLIRNSNEQTIAASFILVDPPDGGFLIGESNLEIDTGLIIDPDFESATYECNLANSNISHFTTFRLIKPYQSISSSGTQIVRKEGEELILSIDLATPPSEVELFNNGKRVLIDGSNVVYGVAGTTNSIRIASVTLGHSGVLQLEAINKASRVVMYFSLTVLGKPVTTTTGGDVGGQVGSNQTLTCNVMANFNDTTVTVTWKKDGATIVQEDVPLTNGTGSASLIVPSLTPRDSGVYECTFENSLGTGNSATFSLLTQTFPPPVITSVDKVKDNGTFVNVTFVPGDGGQPDGHVVEIQYKTDDGQMVTKTVMLGANETFVSIPVNDSATGIRVRVKSVRNGQDITEYSQWTVVPDGNGLGYYHDKWWVIFLTVLFSVIGGCGLFWCIVLCLVLICCPLLAAKKDDEEEDDEEKKKERSESPDSIASDTSV
jgi:hypothetical protein